METFELGVGDLVQFVMRSGSIDTRVSGKSRMQQGSALHRKIQENDSEVKTDYKSEVFFRHSYPYRDYNFILTGRADAIYKEKGRTVIEEIKTTTEFKTDKFQEKEVHRAQLSFYGLFYMLENDLDEIDLTLHYYHIPTDESSYFKEEVKLKELIPYINSILDKWLEIGILKSEWMNLRDESIQDLPFVYGDFRKGQREMSLAVYNTIKRDARVLIEAPTGIGKTAASLFPAIKALQIKPEFQIYYLTAKTTIQQEANKALRHMREQGLKLKSVTITARDKVCFLNQEKEGTRSCNPDDCPYAKNFFEKMGGILPVCIKTQECYDREYIEKTARLYEICPYQLSLELSNWSDVVICDYNYAFDPVSQLQNFNVKRICLIDEAHNLPDRSRTMYSAELLKEDFKTLELALQEDKDDPTPKKGAKGLKRQAKKLCAYLGELEEDLVPVQGDVKKLDENILDELLEKLTDFQQAAFIYFLKIQDKKIEPDEEILAAYNTCSQAVYQFIVISEFFNTSAEKYHFYAKETEKGILIRLACLDASEFIRETLSNNPAVLFSATLTPFDYYKQVLLGEKTVPSIAVPSPFDSSNYKVICDSSISTRYSERAFSYSQIAKKIDSFVNMKKGHYLVFFPSYTYLKQVLEEYKKLNDDETSILVQRSNMNEDQRKRFLSKFKKDKDKLLVGFCVMGGIFSEGVDLPFDELIGTVIIGVGLPGLDYERDLIKDYYQEENGEGYAYAYAFPGMNRVLQSAGRVIRTEEDKGMILLIDDRFSTPFYRRMLPPHLIPEYLSTIDDIEAATKAFWESQLDGNNFN